MAKSTTPLALLLVEDDEVLLRALYLLLEKEGYSIASATDGDTALAMARRIKPDVILLDLLLPKMSGFDVLKYLKSDPALAGIPVVVLSNLGDATDIERVKALGAAEYFVKATTNLEELVKKIRSIHT